MMGNHRQGTGVGTWFHATWSPCGSTSETSVRGTGDGRGPRQRGLLGRLEAAAGVAQRQLERRNREVTALRIFLTDGSYWVSTWVYVIAFFAVAFVVGGLG